MYDNTGIIKDIYKLVAPYDEFEDVEIQNLNSRQKDYLTNRYGPNIRTAELFVTKTAITRERK